MKTDKVAETAARYGMRPAAFEKLLVELGWIKNGEVNAKYVQAGELTPLAQGFLDGYFWQRGSR
jgi:N-acetylmuramoyl-L-alanine amidase